MRVEVLQAVEMGMECPSDAPDSYLVDYEVWQMGRVEQRRGTLLSGEAR